MGKIKEKEVAPSNGVDVFEFDLKNEEENDKKQSEI